MLLTSLGTANQSFRRPITPAMPEPGLLERLQFGQHPALIAAERPLPRLFIEAPETFSLGNRGPSPQDLPIPQTDEPHRPEQPTQEPNPLPFLVTALRLIETEQLLAARRMLAVAPVSISNDPLLARLRAVLAPPVATRLDKRDVDRTPEFEWLRREGHRHRGRWVALTGDALLAEAPTLRELRELLKSMLPTRRPLIHHVVD
jgi:hypothetical protein